MSANSRNKKKSVNLLVNSNEENKINNALIKIETEFLNSLGLKFKDTASSYDDCMSVSIDGTLVSYFIEPIRK